MACARVTGVVSAGLPRAAQRAIAPNHARRLIAFALLYHPHLLKNCLVFGSASLQPNTCSDGHTRSMIDGCNLCAACPWPEPSQHRCHLSIAAECTGPAHGLGRPLHTHLAAWGASSPASCPGTRRLGGAMLAAAALSRISSAHCLPSRATLGC